MRKNLYLYLTLACFLFLIAIFIGDGYMGVYDTVTMTSGERVQEIDSDSWLRGDYYSYMSVGENEKAEFTYQVDNRRFISYSADVGVSLWHNLEKVADITEGKIAVGSFGKDQVTWVVNSADFMPEGASENQNYEYTLVITRGDIERRVVVNVNLPLKVR